MRAACLRGNLTSRPGGASRTGSAARPRNAPNSYPASTTLCAQLGESPSAVALAWLLHQNGIAATIIGPATKQQLTSVLHVPEIALSDEALKTIDAIFPACGAAPEAYAW